MAGSNKKSTVIKDTKPLKKGKRKAKDDSETKVNQKKPKKGVIAPLEKKKSDQKEIMKGFGDCQSISVEGFDSSLSVDDIKSALSKHFSSFGEITRVYVPADRETGASLGYAYVDLKEGAEKALELGGHDVGGWNLEVGKAEPIRSGSSWRFPGRCGNLGFCGYC